MSSRTVGEKVRDTILFVLVIVGFLYGLLYVCNRWPGFCCGGLANPCDAGPKVDAGGCK